MLNIPESTAVTSETRQDHGVKFAKELCDTLEVNLNFNNPIIGLEWGKVDKDRPLRITATS